MVCGRVVVTLDLSFVGLGVMDWDIIVCELVGIDLLFITFFTLFLFLVEVNLSFIITFALSFSRITRSFNNLYFSDPNKSSILSRTNATPCDLRFQSCIILSKISSTNCFINIAAGSFENLLMRLDIVFASSLNSMEVWNDGDDDDVVVVSLLIREGVLVVVDDDDFVDEDDDCFEDCTPFGCFGSDRLFFFLPPPLSDWSDWRLSLLY